MDFFGLFDKRNKKQDGSAYTESEVQELKENRQQAEEKADRAENPAKIGPDGEFDESGLAKRVYLAMDAAGIDGDIWVAQTGSKVIIKYNESAAELVERAEAIARDTKGCTEVESMPNT